MGKTKRRSPGDGALFQRKSDGLWVGSVEIIKPDGQRGQKRVYSKNYKQAKADFDELRSEIASGNIPISNTTTVAAYLTRWLEIKKAKVSQSTYDYYEEAVRLHIVPNLTSPKVRLRKFTPEDGREMIARANTTANAQRAHKTLKLALKAAVADGLLKRNIMDSVDKPGHVARVREVLDFDAATLAIRAAIKLDESRDESDPTPLLATRWAAGFLTVARPAELRGLELNRISVIDAAGKRVDLDDPSWSSADVTAAMDLSWQLKQLRMTHGCSENPEAPTCGRVRPSYCPAARWDLAAGTEYRECHGSMIWKATKTQSSKRATPISAPLLEMLRVHVRLTTNQPNPHGLVWRHRDGRPISETDENMLWHQFLRDAGLPRIEQYAATRHTANTLLQRLGTAEEVRMQIAGHSSRAAHEAYTHIDQAQKREALEKLARRLLGTPENDLNNK